ncbi:MAG: 23S rRNA (guanosine(2251)-2'-O)-methyltransferase RlmB [bacterium]
MNIFGKNVIYAALDAKHRFYEIFLREDVHQKDFKFVERVKKAGIKLHVLKGNEMDKMFKGLHQGYGANVTDYDTNSIDDIIDTSKKQLIVILDKLNDPNNLGAIIRSCDAFGIDGIVIPKNRSVAVTDTVVKISTGAIEYVKICQETNINQTIDYLKKNGFWIVGTDASATTSIYDVKFDTSLAIVIGSEGYGISQLTQKKCDFLTKIPMYGHVNSLNASASAAICLSALVNNKHK